MPFVGNFCLSAGQHKPGRKALHCPVRCQRDCGHSEAEVQRELNQAGAADGVLDEAQTGWHFAASDRTGTGRGGNGSCPLAPLRRAGLDIRAETGIQAEVGIGSVKARVIEQIEELRIKTQHITLFEFDLRSWS